MSSSRARRLMKILFMTETLHHGGSENQMTQVAVHLSARHQVTVGALRVRGKYLDRLHSAGIPVVEFDPGGSLISLGALKKIWELRRFLRRERFDVVHTYDVYSNCIGVPAARLAGVRVFSSQRDLSNWSWYTKRNRKILRWVQKLSRAVVANSEAVRQSMLDEDGFPSSKIRVIRNAVETGRLPGVKKHGAEIRKRIVTVANMHFESKGHACLIEAARKVCDHFPKALFVLVGEGALRTKFEKQVAELKLADNFSFLGARSDVPELLAGCDIGVLPSLAEGLPNAVLEALAAGLPVVASCVGGIPEIIEHGKNGLLVPPGDPDALAVAIMRLLGDERYAADLGVRGLETARNEFSFERLATQLEELYGDIASDKC